MTMDGHFFIAANEAIVEKTFSEAFVAAIDGKESLSLKDFIVKLSDSLEFPEEPGKNLEALDEILSDLQWIDEKEIVVYINQSADWLGKEKPDEKVLSVIDLIDAIAEDWKWLDEEEEEIEKKDLKIVFQESARIHKLLKEQGIGFEKID